MWHSEHWILSVPRVVEAALDANLIFVPRDIIGQVVRAMGLGPSVTLWGPIFFINFRLVRML